MTVVENAKAHPADVVLMDIDMPGRTGIEGVRLLKEAEPDQDALMLTVFDDDQHVFEAVCAGATGYLLKKTPPDRLLAAIEDLHAGGAPMSPGLAKRVLTLFAGQVGARVDYALTEREQGILELLVAGNSYKMIAASMTLSLDTVRFHIKNVYRKLHVNSLGEAVAKALRERIV
jgi:DNA-binding NarL/FixJ family response regulator